MAAQHCRVAQYGAARPVLRELGSRGLNRMQVSQVLCFGLLPRQAALRLIISMRAGHQAQPASFLARAAALAGKQSGSPMVARRNVLAEPAYHT